MTRVRTLLPALPIALCLVAIGPADAAKKSCKNKKEKSGCKLPENARYGGQATGSGYQAYGSLSAFKGRFHIEVSVRDIPLRDGSGCKPSIDRVIGVVRKSAKVGKSYPISVKRATPFSFNNFKGTLKVTSAKSATLKGDYVSNNKVGTPPREGNVARCKHPVNAKMKRLN